MLPALYAHTPVELLDRREKSVARGTRQVGTRLRLDVMD
jgi:hypothetical protein